MKNRTSVRIMIAVWIAAIISVVAADTSANAAQQAVNGRIVKEVRHELVTLPYYGVFDWLQYEVRSDNTVILRGQVVRPSTKSDAEARVREIDGVKRVVNEIQALPLSP